MTLVRLILLFLVFISFFHTSFPKKANSQTLHRDATTICTDIASTIASGDSKTIDYNHGKVQIGKSGRIKIYEGGILIKQREFSFSEMQDCVERFIKLLKLNNKMDIRRELVQIGKLCNEGNFSEAAAWLSPLIAKTGLRDNVNADPALLDVWQNCDQLYVSTELDTIVFRADEPLYVLDNTLKEAELEGRIWSYTGGISPFMFDVTRHLLSDNHKNAGCWGEFFGTNVEIKKWECLFRGRHVVSVALSLPEELARKSLDRGTPENAICEMEADLNGRQELEILSCYSTEHHKFGCVLQPISSLTKRHKDIQVCLGLASK